jgi:WD40 repeat protein
MGVVLRAWDPGLGRTVALKVVRPEQVSAVNRARFEREARSAAGLKHDHIVTVYGAASSPHGLPYLVMEYVRGPNLRDQLSRQKRLAPAEAARICAEVADGLGAAHAAGLVHRDIKPSNIMLDAATGRAKLVDFGLARGMEADGPITRDGTRAGTPEYMSPEQVHDPAALTAASDIYGVGVTLYEALTGEVPFRGTPEMVAKQLLDDEPVPPRRRNSRIPRDLETICLKCLRKEPARRYATAAELSADLQRFLRGEPIRARPVRLWERAVKWARRRPAVAALLGVLVLGGATAWRYEGQLREADKRAAVEAERRQAAEEIAALQRYFLLTSSVRERALDPRLGWTWEGLEALQEASRLADDPRERVQLRSLATRCLAGVDLRRVATLAQGRPIFCLEFSPDGRLLAVGQELGLGDCSVRLYEVASRRLVHELSHPMSPDKLKQTGIRALTFSPDGRWLAVGTRSGELHFWDLSQSPPARTIRQGHQGRVLRLAFHPVSGLLLSCGNDDTLRLWELPAGREVGRREVRDASDAVYSNDGRWLAYYHADGVHLLPAGDLERFRNTPVSREDLLVERNTPCICFHPSDKFMAICPSHLLLHRFGDGFTESHPWFKDPLVPGAHEGLVNRLAFTPDGSLLVSVGGEQTVKVWEAAAGRLLLTVPLGGTGHADACLSPDGRWLATTGDEEVRLYEVRQGAVESVAGLHSEPVLAMDWAPDGREWVCITHSNRGQAGYWYRLHRWGKSDRQYTEEPPVRVDSSWSRGISASLASPAAGRRNALALATPEAGVRLWDLAARQVHAPVGSSLVHRLSFAPDGTRLWAALPDGQVESRSWPDLQFVSRWQNQDTYEYKGSKGIRSLAAGDHWVLAGTLDPATKLLRARDGLMEREWPSPGGPVYSVALSPDETLAVSGTQQGVVQVVRVPDAVPVMKLAVHQNSVEAVLFSPDGRLLATGSRDGTVCLWLWDGEAMQELLTFRLPGPVMGLQFHPEGRRLAVLVQGEKAIRVWHLDRLRDRLNQLGLGW